MKKILIPGLIAGGFAGIWGCLMCIGGIEVSMSLGMTIGYLTMLIGLTAVFLAIKRRRDVDQGGVIRFWPAFGLGLAISLVAGIVYALMFEATLAMFGFDAFVERMLVMSKEGGATPKEIAEMREFFSGSYANPLVRILISIAEMLPVGVLVSLISAALLRNPRFMPAPVA
ncbi:DUF4199 domain-containing protein [Sphingomonas sp.]|uniref:DUF4199 domain-containing protein n=1 Tax=Sphingomonas sp. TaxID=28214 RepID=UPI002ED82C2F